MTGASRTRRIEDGGVTLGGWEEGLLGSTTGNVDTSGQWDGGETPTGRSRHKVVGRDRKSPIGGFGIQADLDQDPILSLDEMS